MANKILIMIWRKRFPSKLNLIQSKQLSLHLRIKSFHNQLKRQIFNLMMIKQARNQGLQRRDSMLMLTINHQMRMIKLFHLSINPTQDGKLMYASSKNIMQIMENIVTLKLPNNQLKQNQNQKKTKKLKNSVRSQEKNSKKLQIKHNHGSLNITQLQKFQITLSQTHMISETLRVLILLIH